MRPLRTEVVFEVTESDEGILESAVQLAGSLLCWRASWPWAR